MTLYDEHYEDLLNYIHNTPDSVFWMGMKSRTEIMKDKKLLDKLWTEYERQLEFGVDAEYAYAYTLEEVLNVPLRKWEPDFEKYILLPFNELYGHK